MGNRKKVTKYQASSGLNTDNVPITIHEVNVRVRWVLPTAFSIEFTKASGWAEVGVRKNIIEPPKKKENVEMQNVHM